MKQCNFNTQFDILARFMLPWTIPLQKVLIVVVLNLIHQYSLSAGETNLYLDQFSYISTVANWNFEKLKVKCVICHIELIF